MSANALKNDVCTCRIEACDEGMRRVVCDRCLAMTRGLHSIDSITCSTCGERWLASDHSPESVADVTAALLAEIATLRNAVAEWEMEIHSIADFIADGDQCPHAVTRLNAMLEEMRLSAVAPERKKATR